MKILLQETFGAQNQGYFNYSAPGNLRTSRFNRHYFKPPGGSVGGMNIAGSDDGSGMSGHSDASRDLRAALLCDVLASGDTCRQRVMDRSASPLLHRGGQVSLC
jgi:hypothetical protein